MGAAFDNEETVALLPKQAESSAHQVAVAIANLEAGEREWDGRLLNCCAGCGVNGWSSCVFSYCVPCLAFGYAGLEPRFDQLAEPVAQLVHLLTGTT